MSIDAARSASKIAESEKRSCQRRAESSAADRGGAYKEADWSTPKQSG